MVFVVPDICSSKKSSNMFICFLQYTLTQVIAQHDIQLDNVQRERGRSVLVMRAHYRSAGLTLHQRGWTDAGWTVSRLQLCNGPLQMRLLLHESSRKSTLYCTQLYSSCLSELCTGPSWATWSSGHAICEDSRSAVWKENGIMM